MNISKPKNSHTALTVFSAVILLITALFPAWSVQANGSLASSPLTAPAAIYGDSLAVNWSDWSWDATRNLSNPSPVQNGSASISVSFTKAWGALYLHSGQAQSTSGYTHLVFYIHGGSTGGQKLWVIANGNNAYKATVTAPASTFNQVSIPFSSLGSPASITDLYFQDSTGTIQPKFYIDSISLVDKSGTQLQTATYLPVVTNTPTPVPTGKFTTLPPGSALPSGSQCASLVKHKAENKRMNVTYNATQGNQTVGSIFAGAAGTSIYNSRIDGKYTGTTDDILQWAACKWGIDEDIVRAQAAVESWWRQTNKGDWTTDASRCAPGHGLGVDGTAGQCPESFGIVQNRYPYEQDAWPGIYNSTAFNVDVAYGYWRACYEGYTTWLGNGYAKGDTWGCVGRWYAGAWHTTAAETYITKVKSYLNQRIWETASFQEP